MNLRIATAALLAILSGAAWAEERKIVLGSSEYPPYFGENLPKKGVISEIVTEAFALVGYQVETRFMPFARTHHEGKNGTIDGIIALWHSQEREQWFIFSDPLPPNVIGIYKRSSDPLQIASYVNLRGHLIGVVNGYANPPGFDQSSIDIDRFRDDEQSLRVLLAGHVDYALIDKGVAQYLIRTRIPQAATQLEWVGPPLESKPQYVVFSKNVLGAEQMARDFNEGLRRLIAAGRLQAILAEQGFAR